MNEIYVIRFFGLKLPEGENGKVNCSLIHFPTCSYCGHGSGNKFMSGDLLQTFRCRAVCLLIGCSSGKLDVNGRLEATGLVTNYLLGGRSVFHYR